MKLPKSLMVMGIPFKIDIVEDLDDFGECVGADRTIKIKKGQKPDQLKFTLMHEIIHAVFYVTGHSARMRSCEAENYDEEEALVLALENGLSQLYELRDIE